MKNTELFWQREKNILLQLEISERLRKFGDEDDDSEESPKTSTKMSAAPQKQKHVQARRIR